MLTFESDAVAGVEAIVQKLTVRYSAIASFAPK